LFSSACNSFPSNFPGGTEPICNTLCVQQFIKKNVPYRGDKARLTIRNNGDRAIN
jgi:hypothetical protein